MRFAPAIAFGLLISFSHAIQAAENPFEEIVPYQELRTIVPEWLAKIDEAIILSKDSAYPSCGRRILEISPGGRADKAGVTVGSILTQRGNWNYWGRYAPDFLYKDTRKISYWHPEKGIQDFQAPAKWAPKNSADHYRPELAFLRGEIGVKNEAWDRQLTLALLALRTHPALAETALYHAFENGYQTDTLTDWFRVLFSMYRKEGAESAMEHFLSQYKDKPIPWILIPPLQFILATSPRIDFMERIQSEAGENVLFDRAYIQKAKAWERKNAPELSISLLDRSKQSQGKEISHLYNNISKRNKSKKLNNLTRLSAGPGRYNFYKFESKENIPNIRLVMKFDLSGNGIHDRFGSMLQIALYNSKEVSEHYIDPRIPATNSPVKTEQRHAYVTFIKHSQYNAIHTAANQLPGAQFRHRFFHIPFVENPEIVPARQHIVEENWNEPSYDPLEVELDIIRLGCEVGIYVNQVCFSHTFTDPSREEPFQIYIHNCGMETEISDCHIYELNPQPKD